MNQINRFVLSVFLVFLVASAAFSRDLTNPPEGFVETADVRGDLFDDWLSAGISPLMSLASDEVTDRFGRVFAVRRERDDENGLLAVRIQARDAAGIQGQWVLYRSFSDGLPHEIRIYPLDNSRIWVSLFPGDSGPESGKSRLDLVLYGSTAVSGIPVGVPLVKLYTASFQDIMLMTRALVPWDLLDHHVDDYAAARSAVSVIRDRLPSLVYLDDGAFDHDGRPVHIRDGSPQSPAEVLSALGPGQTPDNIAGGVNCSGFAKWIVDGIVFPEAGSRLFLDPLKKQTDSPETHFTEPFRESRDVFFALDWTRQLASAVVSLGGRGTVLPAESGADVTVDPFPGFARHVPGVGYRSGALQSLLYWLAIRESGHMYLAAISRERGDPPLRQYHHIAVLFPYFDEHGQFTIAVFESAAETPYPLFVSRNDDAYIHLVRVRCPEKGRFIP